MLTRTQLDVMSSGPERFALLVMVLCTALSGPLAVATESKVTTREAALTVLAHKKSVLQKHRLDRLRSLQSPIEQRWGIKLSSLKLTAANYGLELRYVVLDADRAAPLLYRSLNLQPMLEAAKSGATLGVPFTQKAGFLRSSVSSRGQIQVGKTYSVLFANPAQHVSIGDRVKFSLGDLHMELTIGEVGEG